MHKNRSPGAKYAQRRKIKYMSTHTHTHSLLTKTNLYKNQKLKFKKQIFFKTAPSKGAITLPQIQLSLCCMLCYYTQYHTKKITKFFLFFLFLNFLFLCECLFVKCSFFYKFFLVTDRHTHNR